MLLVEFNRSLNQQKENAMAAAALDPKTALILIDLQKGIVAMPTAHPVGEIVKRASVLADAFRRRKLPVVLVDVSEGAPGRTSRCGAGSPPSLARRTRPGS